MITRRRFSRVERWAVAQSSEEGVGPRTKVLPCESVEPVYSNARRFWRDSKASRRRRWSPSFKRSGRWSRGNVDGVLLLVMARGTGRKEDAQNIFVLCRNLVFSKIYSQRTQQACLGHCVRSLPRLLDMSQRRCHIRVIEFSTTSRILPTSVGRGEGTWNPTMSFMWCHPGRCPKQTHASEREPSIASEPIGLRGFPSHQTTRKP